MPNLLPRVLLKKNWPLQLRRKRVSLSMDSAYFVGNFVKVGVKLRGLTLDDLDFILPDGGKAGVISLSRDSEFDPINPDIMLCIGYEPGVYKIQVVEKSSNILMYEQKYEITTDWFDQKRGPSLTFTGVNDEIGENPAWGGGPGGLQNINISPAIGTRRIAVIMIGTADAPFPTDAATVNAISTRWMNEIINGVTANGRSESARQFYREVSYNTYDLSADIFGPVNLPNNWGTYFDVNAAPNVGRPLNGFYQAATTAADSLVNYNNYDNLIFISEQFANGGAPLNAWPYGGGAVLNTAEGSKSLGVVSMPREWGAAFRPSRTVRSTVIHELGHSIRLGDQYTPDTGRNVGNWDPMHAESNLPHFSIAHRMMLGWIQPAWMKAYNFATGGGVINETISLSPIENGAPPAGQLAGIEVRIADGWNYYVEYRSAQSAQIGDRFLDTNNAVLITDVDSSPGDAPISRPKIIRVNNDSDGDGSILINGLDYKETDASDPTFPTDFKMSVSGISATKADVKVEYGVNSRPDPAIRPWPASPERRWQSPDIEVQNAKNIADPAWFNVPWAGQPNTIIAKVKNNGNLAAPNVKVNFYVKNFNVGGTPETFLGTDTQNISALGTTNFTMGWNPPGNGHYCVIVRIEGYLTTGPNPVLEMSIFNNEAQSNYTRFNSASASPASREISFVEVGNPYEKETKIYIRSEQNNPFYRTYLETTSLLLQPGEVKKIKVMFEFDETNLFKTPISLGKYEHFEMKSKENKESDIYRKLYKKHRFEPNKVKFAAYIDNPLLDTPHTPTRLGGVDIEVVTGKKTKFEYFYVDGKIGGRVIEDSQNREPTGVGVGCVLVIFKNDKDPDNPNVIYEKANLSWDGHFGAEISKKAIEIEYQTVQAYYLPAKNYDECYSEILKRNQ